MSLLSVRPLLSFIFFFFNDTATTEIYTLSLHDALPICSDQLEMGGRRHHHRAVDAMLVEERDRKSTRLNSSHVEISYAVFCLKKKKNYTNTNGHLTRGLTRDTAVFDATLPCTARTARAS